MLGVILALVLGILLAVVFVIGVFWYRRGQSIEHFVQPSDYLGRPAVVLLPIRATQRGKVRLELNGQRLELAATTESDRSFDIGEIVYGVQWDDCLLWVLAKEQFWD